MLVVRSNYQKKKWLHLSVQIGGAAAEILKEMNEKTGVPCSEIARRCVNAYLSTLRKGLIETGKIPVIEEIKPPFEST